MTAKKVIKAPSPAPKTVANPAVRPKKTTVTTPKSGKIQTAEGWKRAMLREKQGKKMS